MIGFKRGDDNQIIVIIIKLKRLQLISNATATLKILVTNIM